MITEKKLISAGVIVFKSVKFDTHYIHRSILYLFIYTSYITTLSYQSAPVVDCYKSFHLQDDVGSL